MSNEAAPSYANISTIPQPISIRRSTPQKRNDRTMAAYDYNNTDWAAIKRLSNWYSGDIHDVLDGRGPYGYLKGISQFGILAPGHVVCGPVSTVLYEKSSR